jgi:type II secretory pathway pseudopilin PulG
MTATGDHSWRRGITLVEAVIAMVLIAVMAAAGLSAAGQASTHRMQMEQRAFAEGMAQMLFAEVLSKSYVEGDVIGPDAGETQRAQFDDVDDFDGYGESPIRDVSGNVLTDTTWKANVAVSWIDPASGAASLLDQGAKAVRVTILKQGKTLAVYEGVSTRQWSSIP